MHMYLKALRAWSLTASGLPVLLGNVLAYRDMSVQPAVGCKTKRNKWRNDDYELLVLK